MFLYVRITIVTEQAEALCMSHSREAWPEQHIFQITRSQHGLCWPSQACMQGQVSGTVAIRKI